MENENVCVRCAPGEIDQKCINMLKKEPFFQKLEIMNQRGKHNAVRCGNRELRKRNARQTDKKVIRTSRKNTRTATINQNKKIK